MATEFAQIIGPLAQSLLGEPNRAYSSEHELRYGAKGSLSVDLQKGTWFDHEANEGGGALDLVTRETRLVGAERFEWLKSHGFDVESNRPNGNGGVVYLPSRPTIVATYDYHDEGGALLFQVVRYEPKDFRQRRPDGSGGWDWSVKGVRQVPYRLPQILENDDRLICIVEGEKDVERLWKLGVPATCNAGGAGKWRDELSEYFRGADVVVIPDRDPQKKHPKTGELQFHPDGRPMLPGQDHAAAVAKALQGTAKRVRVLELWKHWREMPPKGDVSDWIKNGGTAEGLYALIEKTPDWSEAHTDVVPVPLLYPFPINGKEIPRRKWIVPGLLLRRNVTILVAPPGSGKSLLTLQMGLMMSTGMVWAGWRPRGKCKVLIINAEDDNDEMRRRLYAACEEMEITTLDELRQRLAIAEAPGDIIIAKADSRTKTVIAQPMVKRLVATVIEHGFDVLIVDPFAETFEGDENSNSELKWAAVLWRQIARETNAAVMLVHHTRKFGAEAGNMDSARGGGALVGVARIVSTLFSMTEEEAVIYGVDEEERYKYLRFDDAKANLSLVTFAARWFTKQTVTLPNGEQDEPPDDVGVLMPWTPKAIFARITNDNVNDILDAITAGVSGKDGNAAEPYTKSRRGEGNRRWAGRGIQGLIECTDDEAQKLIDTWLKSGLLYEVEGVTATSKGKMRKGLVVNDSKRPGTLVSESKL
jgi:AAA domain-containing protein